jgi:hypothetical protein
MVRDGSFVRTFVIGNTDACLRPRRAAESSKLGWRVACLDYHDSSYVYLKLTTQLQPPSAV